MSSSVCCQYPEDSEPNLALQASSECEAIAMAKQHLWESYKVDYAEMKLTDDSMNLYREQKNHADDLPEISLRNFQAKQVYILLNAYRKPFLSDQPGKIGGHKGLKIYGRLDCPSALRALKKGQYAAKRVFFPDEETAINAGYRPCGICMKEEYRIWKQTHGKEK